ncbi:uncharacterized protein V1518DRAFT_11164 [Limtongia smithiae]|uniref:uncharacterized protein n=1 Tax=Limtongia smithiae TaxID=1125753 RepID=UPI0034CD6308
MMVNGVAVMRRRSDSYLNATQILKVGGVDKGRRTKILEKEIHTGEHEKVQGGYGKYQGTWIPFDRGRKFCRQYFVEDILAPLLNFDPAAPQSEQTPTKEQAMAARRKQMYAVASAQNSVTSQGANQSLSHSVFNVHVSGRAAQSAASAARNMASIDSTVSRERMMSFSGETATDADDDGDDKPGNDDDDGPPRKRPCVDNISKGDMETTSDYMERTLEPLDANAIPNYEQSREVLTQIFLTNETSGVSQLSILDTYSTPKIEIDVAIDELGHAALHWAAALARIQLARDLVYRGADPRRGNYNGETALIRAVLVTNNLDQVSFPQLLDLLYPAIPLRDNQGRTVLHHISLTAGILGRASASRYYLECLLEWIVRHGSVAGPRRSVGLSRFMAEVVNAQDKNGDTSLNIAARVGNKGIVQQLLEVGADVTIPNRAGLRPLDFGVGFDVAEGSQPPQLAMHVQMGAFAVPPEVIQKSKDIIASMSSRISLLDKDFQDELQAKQVALDNMHMQLREATITLATSRTRAEKLREMVNRINDLNQRDRNLENAIKEEEERYHSVTEGSGKIGSGDGGGKTRRTNSISTTSGNGKTDKLTTRGTQQEGHDELSGVDDPMIVDEAGDVTMADLDMIDDSHSDDVTGEVDADRVFKLDIIEDLRGSQLGSDNAVPNESNGEAESAKPAEESTGATVIDAEPQSVNGTTKFSPDGKVLTAADTTTTTSVDFSALKVIGPLPPIPVLRARISAYKRNQMNLHALAESLRDRSSDLEDKFRAVVAQCTNVRKEDVDSLLTGLVQAVQSDPAEVDMVRVAGFLRNVDDGA